jgi:Domain of unknown function (DUF4440)
MRRIVSSATLLLVMTAGVFAQTAPDAAELTKLLNDFLAGASRNDPAVHERFWADDLIYTRSAGRRVNKAEILHDVRNEPAPKPSDPKTVYTAEDIRIQQYGDTAVVAFRLVATTETSETRHVANLLNSGTFVKRNGKWQVVNWQSTRMPYAEADLKTGAEAIDLLFFDSIRKSDVDKLTELTDANFIWIAGTREITRQQMLDDVRAGKLKYGKVGSGRPAVSVYGGGDTVVVRGSLASPTATHYTLTLSNQVGGWKAVALHTSN